MFKNPATSREDDVSRILCGRRINEAVHNDGLGFLERLKLHCIFQLSRLCCPTMSAPKLAAQEITLMDDMQKDGEEPKDILAKHQRNRARKRSHGPGHTAVYNFLAGTTHRRDATENRGPISKMPPRLVSVAVRMRKPLTQQANNEYLVTWDDNHAATKTELGRLVTCEAWGQPL